jgi:hypothetical protein
MVITSPAITLAECASGGQVVRSGVRPKRLAARTGLRSRAPGGRNRGLGLRTPITVQANRRRRGARATYRGRRRCASWPGIVDRCESGRRLATGAARGAPTVTSRRRSPALRPCHTTGDHGRRGCGARGARRAAVQRCLRGCGDQPRSGAAGSRSCGKRRCRAATANLATSVAPARRNNKPAGRGSRKLGGAPLAPPATPRQHPQRRLDWRESSARESTAEPARIADGDWPHSALAGGVASCQMANPRGQAPKQRPVHAGASPHRPLNQRR